MILHYIMDKVLFRYNGGHCAASHSIHSVCFLPTCPITFLSPYLVGVTGADLLTRIVRLEDLLGRGIKENGWKGTFCF